MGVPEHEASSEELSGAGRDDGLVETRPHESRQSGLTFADDWIRHDDGGRWSHPEGSSCIVHLPESGSDPALAIEVVCDLRIEAMAVGASATVGLLITLRDVMLQDLLLISGATHHVRLILPAALGQGDRLGFRAFAPHAEDAAPAVTIHRAEITLRARDDRGKEAIIKAGLAASTSLFPQPFDEDPAVEAARLADILAGAIRARQPFSMVRLGDGEGRILTYPSLLTETESETETIRYMFGPAAVARLVSLHGPRGVGVALSTLRTFLGQAVANADCLGLPSPIHFGTLLAMRREARTLSDINCGVGYAGAILGAAGHAGGLPAGRIFDTFIFYALHHHALFDRFLTGLDYLGLVAHSDLSGVLERRFGIRTVEHVAIPGHAFYMPGEELHFPDRYEAIIQGLRVPFQGAPYIVCAGYLGKLYCDVIKARGGIAIDVGSVFDGWSGLGRTNVARDVTMRLSPS